jgi:TonB family protein
MTSVRVLVGILLAALVASPAWSHGQSAPPAAAARRVLRIRIPEKTRGFVPTRLVEPDYPTEARQAHAQGTVVLHTIVANDGTVMKVEYVSGPQLLTDPAIVAVKQWAYGPTKVNGERVEVDTTISVVFALDEKGNLKPQPKHP